MTASGGNRKKGPVAYESGKPGAMFKRFVATGVAGALVLLALSLASIAFIIAMKSTTVANALFLSSCAPLLERPAFGSTRILRS